MSARPAAGDLVATQIARALATLDDLCNDPALVREGHRMSARLEGDPLPRVDLRRVRGHYLAELRLGARRYAGATGPTPDEAIDALSAAVGDLIGGAT